MLISRAFYPSRCCLTGSQIHPGDTISPVGCKWALADAVAVRLRATGATQPVIIDVQSDDPEPEPTAPAARSEPRPHSVPANAYSTCGLSSKRIHPNDDISLYSGKWCLTDEVVEHERKMRESREYRDQLKHFIDRMGCSAAVAA